MRTRHVRARSTWWPVLLLVVLGAVILSPAVGTAARGAVAQQEVGAFGVILDGSGAGAVIQSPADPTPPPRIECAKGVGNVDATGTCDLAEGVGGQPFPRIIGLEAVTPGGSTFGGWVVYPEETLSDGCGSEPECWVLANEGVIVGAVFNRRPGETPLTIIRRGPDAANGTVVSMPADVQCSRALPICQGKFGPGTSVRLEATPGPNGSFGGWSGPCRPSEDIANVCVATTPVSGNIYATFNTAVDSLTVATEGEGFVASSVQPGISCPETCVASFTRGSNVTLYAYPEDGYRFASWAGASCTSEQCQVTMDQSKTVTATFAAVPVQANMLGAFPIYYGPRFGRRAVLVTLRSTEEVDAVIRLRRGGVTLATRRVTDFGPDTALIAVNVRRLIPGGRTIVQTTFTNSAGTEKTQRRSIRLLRP